MKPASLRLVCLLIAVWCRAAASGAEPESAAPASSTPTPEAIEFFEKQVRPVLAEHCFKCHGPDKQENGLRLDSRAAVIAGGDSGAAVVPGDPAASDLIEHINYGGEIQMPPDEKLPPQAIESLTTWVKLGLPWPEQSGAPADPAAQREAAWKNHWAFQPVALPPVPEARQTDWPLTPVDQFIAVKLEERGLHPSAPCDRRTWIRRATFDLIGLPPSVEEIDAFERDTSPEAYAAVVDRLLASPHYGERWGRYWLDVARYADTKGYVFMEDRSYPNAYKYRDWVVQALNADLPYDRFLIEQIAADRLPPGGDPPALAALGFLTVGRRFLKNTQDIIDDRIDVLARGTMGLTVTCARCHDHKFDPIPSQDYYSLYGVFASTVEPDQPAGLMTMADAPSPHDVHVFRRGNPQDQGDEAPRRFLKVVAGDQRQPFREGSGRLELAQAIASKANPLTARVLVNRVWLHHFGQPLVTTPSDFGMRSQPPSHPELLDYLAWRFMDEGWSLKKLHRLVMLSQVYRQASDDRPECRAIDPENRLLWRMNRQRLDFEAIRDALLAVTGGLDSSVGGPAVPLTSEPFSARRTIYGLIDRQNLPGVFRTFDFASPDAHSAQRFTTTVPQQALFLLNSPFVVEQARKVAARPDVRSASDPAARIALLYQRILGRAPSAHETDVALVFLKTEEQSTASGAPAKLDAWERYAQALLLTNEFMYVD